MIDCSVCCVLHRFLWRFFVPFVKSEQWRESIHPAHEAGERFSVMRSRSFCSKSPPSIAPAPVVVVPLVGGKRSGILSGPVKNRRGIFLGRPVRQKCPRASDGRTHPVGFGAVAGGAGPEWCHGSPEVLRAEVRRAVACWDRWSSKLRKTRFSSCFLRRLFEWRAIIIWVRGIGWPRFVYWRWSALPWRHVNSHFEPSLTFLRFKSY